MRLTLRILGALLIIQVALHVITAAFIQPFSFVNIGKAIDRDIVRLTAGLSAFALSSVLEKIEIRQ